MDDNKAGCGCAVVALLVAALFNATCNNKSPAPSPRPAYTPSYESTEDKLRRVYDSQGIKYDNKMLREDARAVEDLHREFGK